LAWLRKLLALRSHRERNRRTGRLCLFGFALPQVAVAKLPRENLKLLVVLVAFVNKVPARCGVPHAALVATARRAHLRHSPGGFVVPLCAFGVARAGAV
jgi:hypothetical protein